MSKDAYITLFETSEYGEKAPPSKLVELKAWVDAVLQDIPKEYQSSAVLDYSQEPDYDNSYILKISVYYKRPYTKEELDALHKKKEKEKSERVANLEKRLARLKYE